jgi:hypothetical protein
MLMCNIQMNGVLSNDEAECGLNPISEDLDLDAEEDDGNSVVVPSINCSN